jgi:hypothetical protein
VLGVPASLAPREADERLQRDSPRPPASLPERRQVPGGLGGQEATERVPLARDRPAIAHMYPTLLRERYGQYYSIGRNWVRMIGHPRFMHLAVKYGFPRRKAMEFALLFMANLTDGKRGGKKDRLMHALISMAPKG